MNSKTCAQASKIFKEIARIGSVVSSCCWEFYSNSTIKVYRKHRTIPEEYVTNIVKCNNAAFDAIVYEIHFNDQNYFALKTHNTVQLLEQFPQHLMLRLLSDECRHIPL